MFSCEIRCCALSLGVEVGGVLILVLGFEVGFGWLFFFLLPCNSSSQTEAKTYGLKPNSNLNARAAELSLTLFGVLGANHFEDHKSHIV